MRKPIVTVVIPCYNVAKTVRETIASVSAQTMGDLEILAIDNNCTDDTCRVLSEIAEHEPRLRVIHQPVQGLSAARNAGIEAAQGDFVALLDADDLWDSNFLETHLRNLEDSDVGISYSSVRFIDVDGQATGQVTVPKLMGVTAADLLRSNPCTALIVVRTKVLRKIGGFDQNLKSVEDQEFLFRAATNGVGLRGVANILASYRIMPNGLSANLPEMLRCHEQLLEKAGQISPGLVARHGRVARGAMLRYCARRAVELGQESGTARGYLVRMLLQAPDILIREPLTTSKVIARVMFSGAGGAAPRPARFQAEGV